VGRRSIYDVVRKIAYGVSLFGDGDVVIVDGGYRAGGDVVLPCSDYRCVAKELFASLPKILGGGKLGVDLGTAKNGVVYVWRGELVLHAVLDWATVEAVLKSAESVQIHMGSSPYVDMKRALSTLGCREVRLVDELDAGSSRPWLKRRYPELEEDELDALTFTFREGVGVKACV